MDSLAISLMAWIAANSSYDTANMEIPKIVQMTAQEITREAYSDHPKLVPENGVDERVFALYSFEDGANGTIYILKAELADDGAAPDEPAWKSPIFQERLLHELVHHAQYQSGAYETFPCKSFGEREAYELGGKFLAERYTSDPLPNRMFLSRIYSRC